MTAAACPCCGHRLAVDAYAAVVTGRAAPDVAPLLAAAWAAALARLADRHEHLAADLAAAVAEQVGCARPTVRHLLDAAHRRGLIRRRTVVTGQPARRRSVVQLRPIDVGPHAPTSNTQEED